MCRTVPVDGAGDGPVVGTRRERKGNRRARRSTAVRLIRVSERARKVVISPGERARSGERTRRGPRARRGPGTALGLLAQHTKREENG